MRGLVFAGLGQTDSPHPQASPYLTLVTGVQERGTTYTVFEITESSGENITFLYKLYKFTLTTETPRNKLKKKERNGMIKNGKA